MKTTTVTDVNAWLNTKAVKKNLYILNKNVGSSGIQWKGVFIFYKKIEVHIYMPAENITPTLKKKWLDYLSAKNPNITFIILEF